MDDYKRGICPRYSVDVKESGMAYFTIVENEVSKEFTVNLKAENLWEGRNGYSSPHPEHHFICHEDGEIVITPYKYTRLILMEHREGNPNPKIFYRARQWEFDWWMDNHFPNSANAKIYRKIKNFLNY